jgi:cytochrome P450
MSAASIAGTDEGAQPLSAARGECPVAHDLDLMDPGFLSDPFGVLAQRREQTPVFYVPEVDLYFVTRYADAERIFLDPANFSAANASSPVWKPCPAAAEVLATVPKKPTLNNADPPRHGPMRKAVLKALTPRRIAAMESVLREVTRDLIRQIAKEPVADLVAGLTYPLPGYAAFTLLGFPGSHWDMIKQWCRRRVQLTYGRLPDDEQVDVASMIVTFWKYCDRHVALREREPGDDFTTELIRYAADHPDEVVRTDIVTIVYAMALAGHDSTTAAMGNGLRYLLADRSGWAKLIADPGLIPNAVEEMMRFDPPVIGQRRIALRDTEIGGVMVPKGAQLMLTFASVHRDRAQYENPDEFDVTRDGARSQLSFGKGVHLCIGAPLARLEMRLAVELLTRLTPAMRLVEGQDYTIVPNLVFRNLERLMVETGTR